MATTETIVAGPEADDLAAIEGSSYGHQKDPVDFAHRCLMAGSALALWPLGHGVQPFLPVALAEIVGPAPG